MKMRTIKLHPKSILESLEGKSSSFITNFPNDVELLDIKLDLFSNQIFAIIRSDSFEDISESYPAPEFELNYTKTPENYSHKNKSNNAQKASQKIKTVPVLGNCGVEEEFCPEHRKLLSFKVEDNYVIIKPIQYLHAEWSEINDVVKSLGGKWVKGDIISYWAVPLPLK